jgi:hypothetical protein
MLRRFIIAGLALVALTNCSVTPSGGIALSGAPKAAVVQIAKLDTTDIASALAMATAAKDGAAIQCFTFLGPFVTNLQSQLTAPGVKATGVVSGFEAARLLVTQAQSVANAGIPDAVNQNCGWLAASMVTDINGLLLQLGSHAVALPAL